ncbi:MAG: VUT family protein, partial [Planctomycetota bacterium]
NASTMASQLVDSSIILWFIFGGQAADGTLEADSPFGGEKMTGYAALGVFVFNAYLFKAFFAAFDTPLAYLFKALLKPAVGGLDEGETQYEND